MTERVFITGTGIVSSIGMNVEETITSMRLSRTGIGAMTMLDTSLAATLPAAEVRHSNAALRETIGELVHKRVYSRTSLLAILAAIEAVEMAGLSGAELKNTALVSGTSIGGMDQGEAFYKQFIYDNSAANPKAILTHDCGEHAERIAEVLGIQSYVSTISTACSSAANALIHAARLIRHGLYDRAVAGGADALCQFTVNGFHSLMILSDEACAPFDKNRKGLNLGEGAGYLVLESGRSLQQSGRVPLCELTGFGNACDAYHQTASSPQGDGAYLSMTEALRMSGLSPEQIDYINTHGTGTPNNDLSEGNAMKRIFTKQMPAFSSTKSVTGHTLAASGGIEAVLSVLAIQYGMIYPNIHFREPMDELDLIPVSAFTEGLSVRHVLSNSFGFGGNNSSLLFSAC